MLAINNIKTINQLSREFNITRKTIRKWIKRYQEEGVSGLLDRSRRPLSSPFRISDEEVELILSEREKNPTWGGRKLRKLLLNEGKESLPSESTFNRTLKRHGRIDKEESEKRKAFIRFEREKPNELWQMDFKGHFKITKGRCHPLTILDDYSRFSICLKACVSEDEISVRSALEEAFREYGIPDAMTMDNGSPWKGAPPFRLSRLTVWLLRLGIKVGHSTPYHPQTQGKDERFHRSLKEEVLKFHQFKDLNDAQAHFDEWRYKYNYIRRHEGINLSRPIDRYVPSCRPFPKMLPAIEYEKEDIVRKVGSRGQINFNGKVFFVGEHFYGENIALRQSGSSKYDIYFL